MAFKNQDTFTMQDELITLKQKMAIISQLRYILSNQAIIFKGENSFFSFYIHLHMVGISREKVSCSQW